MLRKPAVSIAKRLSSTQVVAHERVDGKLPKTRLKNGLTVVTADTSNKYSNVSVFVKAGSRFENPSSNLGMSHCLRAAACLTSDKSTAWNSTQLLGALGGNFDTTGTRELISYNLKCGRKVWRDLLTEVVAPSLCDSRFFWWEIKDLATAMRHQIARANADPAFRVTEAVHKASFRGGLANSILSTEDIAGSHSSEALQEFFNSHYNLDNMVLVGTGVNHDELCDVGDFHFNLETRGSAFSSPSEFISSEVRQHEMSDAAYVGLSFPGSALNDQDAIAIAILQNILEPNAFVKRKSGLASRLGGAVGKKLSEPFTLSAYNINYSDCGLLGVYVKSTPQAIGKALSAVIEETTAIAEGKISDKEVGAAKQCLKMAICGHAECSQGLIDDIGVQISLLGGYANTEEIALKIDAVTTSQIVRAAKKVFGGKKSLAAVGDISHCPYLSDL